MLLAQTWKFGQWLFFLRASQLFYIPKILNLITLFHALIQSRKNLAVSESSKIGYPSIVCNDFPKKMKWGPHSPQFEDFLSQFRFKTRIFIGGILNLIENSDLTSQIFQTTSLSDCFPYLNFDRHSV